MGKRREESKIEGGVSKEEKRAGSVRKKADGERQRGRRRDPGVPFSPVRFRVIHEASLFLRSGRREGRGAHHFPFPLTLPPSSSHSHLIPLSHSLAHIPTFAPPVRWRSNINYRSDSAALVDILSRLLIEP